MTIELEKELADLKDEHSKMASALDKKIDLKTEQCVRKAVDDFKEFFTKHSFSISEGIEYVAASYKDLEYTLKYVTPDIPYMGSYFVFDFIASKHGKREEYNIILNPKRRTGLSSSAHVMPNNRTDMLKLKIKDEKRRIECTKARLEKIDTEIWDYDLRPDSPRLQLAEPIKCDSLYELLEKIFTTPQ